MTKSVTPQMGWRYIFVGQLLALAGAISDDHRPKRDG
jgi:hypothetical protein